MVESKQMKDCESVVVTTPPTYQTLDELPITSRAAYVLCDKQLYYINKDTNECRNLNLPKEVVDKLTKSDVPFSLECQKLSGAHLMKIENALRSNIKRDSKLEERKKLKDQGASEAQNDSHFLESKVKK